MTTSDPAATASQAAAGTTPGAGTVVMVYTAPPPHIISDAIGQLRAAGNRVLLVGPKIKGTEEAIAAADQWVKLAHRAAPVAIDPANRPQRYTPRWASVVARNLWRRVTFKPFQKTLGAATLWSLTLNHDRHAVHAVDQADVLTAVDGGAVYAVWKASRRNRRAAALNGVGPTLEHFGLST